MEHDNFIQFAEKTIKEIKIWAAAAAILPLTALVGVFFVWIFGSGSLLDISIIVVGTVMFGISVIWWWWALRSIFIIVHQWKYYGKSFEGILEDIREVKNIIKGVTVESDISNRQRRESEDNKP